jgi:hypothetical protein
VPKALNCACSDALATEWVAQWCADRVNDVGWYQFDVAVMDEDVPTGVVYVPMVRFAQQNAIIYTGLTTINPMLPVVRLAHSRGVDHSPGKHNRGPGRSALDGLIVGRCAWPVRRRGVRISHP